MKTHAVQFIRRIIKLIKIASPEKLSESIFSESRKYPIDATSNEE